MYSGLVALIVFIWLAHLKFQNEEKKGTKPQSDESKYWERDFGTNIPFRAYKLVPVDFELPVLPAYLASSITNGMTLGQIVATLGPGWLMKFVSLGVIKWRFSDGRLLCVDPEHYHAEGDVLTMCQSFAVRPKHSHSKSFMWFYVDSTNSFNETNKPIKFPSLTQPHD